MYNFNKWLEKNRSKLKKRNKKVSKFLPAFLVLIITAVSLTVLFKTGGFSKILNLVFKDETYTDINTSADEEIYTQGERSDYFYYYVNTRASYFLERVFPIDWYLNIGTLGNNFKNQDFLFIVDDHYRYSSEFSYLIGNLTDVILEVPEYNNRIAVKYTFSDEYDDTTYSSNAEQIKEKAQSVEYVYPGPTNGYAEAYEFLKQNPPENGREVRIIYLTNDKNSLDKYKTYYELIKTHYSSVQIHFVPCVYQSEEGQSPYLEDYFQIADRVHYPGYDSPYYAVLNGINLYNTYSDIEITARLSEYAELDDSQMLKGNITVTEENGNQVIHFTLDHFDRLDGMNPMLVTYLRLKGDQPAFFPLITSARIDFTPADGVRQHVTISTPIILNRYFSVTYYPNAPAGCNLETIGPITYEIGTQIFHEPAPKCEGYVFKGWEQRNGTISFYSVGPDKFTVTETSKPFYGTWRKVTVKKTAS